MTEVKIAQLDYRRDDRGASLIAAWAKFDRAKEALKRAKRETKRETGRSALRGTKLIWYYREGGIAVYFRGCGCAECSEVVGILEEFLLGS